MELNISKCTYEGQWFHFGDGRLKIRPYPASKQSFSYRDGAVLVPGSAAMDKFKFCLMEWDSFVQPGTKDPIELTDEVKTKIFDFKLGTAVIDGEEVSMADFVLMKADDLFRLKGEAEKN